MSEKVPTGKGSESKPEKVSFDDDLNYIHIVPAGTEGDEFVPGAIDLHLANESTRQEWLGKLKKLIDKLTNNP